jgi:exosortase/archaeosortase family protein
MTAVPLSRETREGGGFPEAGQVRSAGLAIFKWPARIIGNRDERLTLHSKTKILPATIADVISPQVNSGPPAIPANRYSPWLVLVAALWAQLYYACIYGWRYGEYYDYGWYVPPLLMLFVFRLRHHWKSPPPVRFLQALPICGAIALFSALAVLRTLNRTDPRWTLPIWIQAGLVILITFFALHRLGGKAAVRRFIPVIAFACSAIPLPSTLEHALVTRLTDSVIAASVRVLQWIGQPVHAIGDQISNMVDLVQITEGCSGIKSAQSFLMAALFFGEWMVLRPGGRWFMILAGVGTAWALNVIRASSLAWIRFEHGAGAFKDAHDLAGLLSFVIGSAILLGISRLLGDAHDGRRTLRHLVERSPA